MILGLLVGGVLSGQSLIRAAELRSVGTEYSRYFTAIQSFRDKYFALPGDMTNATSFWGAAHATPATCLTTVGTGTQTCNGNGDGLMAYAAAASEYGEIFTGWQHLASAGLIEGSYTGRSGSTTPYNANIGTNTPRSKISNTGWSFYLIGNFAGNSEVYAANYGNTLAFGTKYGATELTDGSALKPEEAWNIDTKLDDGKPGTGRIIVRDNGGFGNASACTTSANQTDYAGTYKFNTQATVCALYFSSVL